MTTLSTLEQCPSEVLDRILLFCAANDEASVSPTRSRWRMLTLSKTLYLLVERALYARVRLSNSKQRDGYRQRISSRPDLGDLCLRLQHNYLHCGSQLDDLVAMLTSLRTMEIKTYTEVAQPGLESLLAVLGSRAALRTVILDLPLILGKLVPLPATLCHVAHLRLGRLISAPDESDLVPVWRSISIAGLAQGTYGNWTTSLLAAQSTLHSLDVSTLEISDVAALVDILVGLRKTLRSLSFRLSSTDMDAGWLWEVIGESQLQHLAVLSLGWKIIAGPLALPLTLRCLCIAGPMHLHTSRATVDPLLRKLDALDHLTTICIRCSSGPTEMTLRDYARERGWTWRQHVGAPTDEERAAWLTEA